MDNENIKHTYREIVHQPQMWLKEYNLILENISKIKSFISDSFISGEYEIILTGAGSSAFIGDVLTGLFFKKGINNCKSVATTDIITHPKLYLNPKKKVVLISFARSGNSPESLATVKIANSICKEVKHIIITCNFEGELALNSNNDNSLLILLPPETNDKSLAMTSSFTTMMLAGLLISDINQIETLQPVITQICNSVNYILNNYEKPIIEIANRFFNRAVFLGSGEKKGIAEECHLKLQELTDGKVICKFDSFLGFRHGPKVVINKDTLLVYLFSNDKYTLQYEKDLVEQVNLKNKVIAQIAVSQQKIEIPTVRFDLEFITMPNIYTDSDYNCLLYVLAGQLIGYFKSMQFRLDPDNPSISGNIARVVEGVKIYDNYTI